MVRARVREDLVNLAKRLGSAEDNISEESPSDYPYRLLVPRAVFADVIGEMLLNLDYDNFKNAVTRKQGSARHNLYMDVWAVMNDAEAYLNAKGIASPRPARVPERALARAEVLMASQRPNPKKKTSRAEGKRKKRTLKGRKSRR